MQRKVAGTAVMACRALLPGAALHRVAPRQVAPWAAPKRAIHRSQVTCQQTQESQQLQQGRHKAFRVEDFAAQAEGNPLFQPYQLGPYHLKHRLVYAPLTRCRSIDTIPQPVMATYYGQRASEGGLMVSEATCISNRAHGYPHTPGIYTPQQIDGWKPVVGAVHEKGAVFFCQLWHVGRASHPDYQPNGELPVSSSALPITDGNQVFSLKEGKMVDFPAPRPLEAQEIPAVMDEYRRAARHALEAGFDGVEVHGANGYLVDQFLKDECNQRSDEYGGSIERRCSFALEVVQAVAEEVGADKVGIRLSPFGGFQNATDSHPYALTTYLLEELNKQHLAYVHLVEPQAGGNADIPETPHTLEPFRKVYKGTVIAAGGYRRENGMEAIATGHADLICYGRWFLANPDLPKRFLLDAPLNKYHRDTFYSQGDEGLIDYPFLEDTDYGKQHAR